MTHNNNSLFASKKLI